MHDVYRLCAAALLLSCAAIFVAVPTVALALGLSERIYAAGSLGPWDVVMNMTALVPLALPLAWAFYRPSVPLPTRVEGEVPLGYALVIVFVWCAVYLLSGGLEYRQTDLYEGYAARSALLLVAQVLTNVVVILVVAVNLQPLRQRWQRLAAALCLVLPAVSLALAGGRGLVVQLLLTFWVARHLWRRQSPSVDEGAGSSVMAFPFLARVSSRVGRLVTPTAVLAMAAGVVLLALWGAAREPDPGSVTASALWRAAEPYWHDAYIVYQRHGVDVSVLSDAIERVLSIPGRWIGFTYPSSVDGAERILEDRLGIPFVEGISLPITFFGEGMLMAGHKGAAMFTLAAAAVALAGVCSARFVPLSSRPLLTALLALQVVKCLFLYPKSLSGTVLVMFYETWRDAIAVLLLTHWAVRRADAR